MYQFRRIAFALAICSLTAACASAPISFAGAGNNPAFQATPVQNTLAEASSKLEETYRERGWIREASAVSGALAWMNRLAGQTTDAPARDRVERYLQVNEIELDAVPARLVSDMRDAQALAQDVDRAAAQLVATGADLSRPGLSHSLGDVETAMSHTRNALDLFDALIVQIAAENGQQEAETLRSVRNGFFAQSEALRDRADELAELRRSGPTAAVS